MFKKIILSLTVVFSGFCFAETVSVFGHNENVSTELVQQPYDVVAEKDTHGLPEDPTSAFGLDFHDPKLKRERAFEKNFTKKNNILDNKVHFMLNEKKEIASLYISYTTDSYIKAENNFEIIESVLTKKYKIHKNASIKKNFNNGVVGHINRRFESKNYIIKLSFYQKPKYFHVEVYYLLKSEVDRLERKLLDDI
tara:strand:+ start:1386 stop:1970 length:585 start_codon:yes stop_codon:yes gene_type:complete